MKFRHSEGVRLALTSGHVTHVGPEWVELPDFFHQAAILAGCQSDNTVTPEFSKADASVARHAAEKAPEPTEKEVAAAKINTNEDTRAVLRTGLIRMIESGKGFTKAGLPDMRVLRAETGIDFDREVALSVFEEMKAA